jgi:hypothetical protein
VPTFPRLGPLGAIPLPSRWRIEFARTRPVAAEDCALVLELDDDVRARSAQKV